MMADIPSESARALANAYEFGGSCPQQDYLFALLTRFRSDDMSMRSVWLCSRNDLINKPA